MTIRVLTAIVVLSVMSVVGADAVETPVKDVPAEMQGMPLVFYDNFAKGADRWEPTDPKAWKIVDENGVKVYGLVGESDYEPAVRSPKNISLIKDLVVGDCVIEARVKQTGREYGHRDFCVFLGHTDPSHFYYVHLASKADPHAHSIFLVNGAPRVSIAKERTDGIKWDDQYHTVRVVRNAASGLIQVYFDDRTQPIMTAEDKTFAAGRIGLGSFDDTGNISEVRIWGKKVEPAARPKQIPIE